MFPLPPTGSNYQPKNAAISARPQIDENTLKDYFFLAKQEDAEARLKLEKAANQDNPMACLYIGDLWRDGNIDAEGQNNTVDYKKATTYYKKAAELKVPAAFSRLAFMYALGRGVETQSFKIALSYGAQAIEYNDGGGYYYMARAYLKGWGVEANEQYYADNLLKTVNIDKEHAPAYAQLGDCYREGRGIELSDKFSFSCYQKAAKLGCTESLIKLGCAYEIGYGVELDHAQAFAHYIEALDLGNNAALYNIAKCYAQGIGVKPDPKKAVAYFYEADKVGSIKSKARLMSLLEFKLDEEIGLTGLAL